MAANWTFFPISLFSVQLALINQIQAVVCTLLLSKFLNHKSPIDGLHTWFKFVICSVIVSPLLSATLAAIVVSLHGLATFNQVFGVWFMSESISVMALTPVGLLYYYGFLQKASANRPWWNVLRLLLLRLFHVFTPCNISLFPLLLPSFQCSGPLSVCRCYRLSPVSYA